MFNFFNVLGIIKVKCKYKKLIDLLLNGMLKMINILKNILRKKDRNKCTEKIEERKEEVIVEKEETVFYKISKSSENVSRFTYEKNYWDYKIGENVEPTGFGFSFVPKETILYCVQYGDILNCLTIPEEEEIEYRGMLFQEHASTKVNVLWQKSLKDVNTLKYMIRLSSNTVIHMAMLNKASRQLLVDLEFMETLKLWDEIVELSLAPITEHTFDEIREKCK